MNRKETPPLQQQRHPYPSDWAFQGPRPPVAQQSKEKEDHVAQQQEQQVQL